MKVLLAVVCVVVVVVVAEALPARRAFNVGLAPSYRPGPVYEPRYNYNTPPRYNYNYGVNDGFGNNYGQAEERDGYSTRGSYFVNLPDGRLQKVSYYVDGDSGYVADVSYVGEARYPTYSGGAPRGYNSPVGPAYHHTKPTYG